MSRAGFGAATVAAGAVAGTILETVEAAAFAGSGALAGAGAFAGSAGLGTTVSFVTSAGFTACASWGALAAAGFTTLGVGAVAAGVFASGTGAFAVTTAFFTALAAALTGVFAAAVLAAGATDVDAIVEAADLEEADLALVLPDTPPRAAEFLTGAVARAAAFALAADFAVVAVFALVTDLALLVFAAVFADFAAALAGALAGAAAAFDAVLALDEVLPLVAALAALLALDLLDWVEAEAVARDRADCDAFFVADPREREDAVVTPAPFFFSFFVADGIRGTLLLRPAVETGRNCRSPTVPRCNRRAGKSFDLAP